MSCHLSPVVGERCERVNVVRGGGCTSREISYRFINFNFYLYIGKMGVQRGEHCKRANVHNVHTFTRHQCGVYICQRSNARRLRERG